jgi:hypothetical protein
MTVLSFSIDVNMPYALTLPAAGTSELAANVNTSTINTARNKAIFFLLVQTSIFLNFILLLRMVIPLSKDHLLHTSYRFAMLLSLLIVMRSQSVPRFVMSKEPVNYHLRHDEIVGLPDMLSALRATLPNHCFTIIRDNCCRAFRADDPKLRHDFPFILKCLPAFVSRSLQLSYHNNQL